MKIKWLRNCPSSSFHN